MKKLKTNELSRELISLDSLKTLRWVFIALLLFISLWLWSLPSYGQGQKKDTLKYTHSSDSTYFLIAKKNKVYEYTKTGKKKSRCNFIAKNFHLDTVEMLNYLDTLFSLPLGSIHEDRVRTHHILKTTWEYSIDLRGLCYKDSYHTGVYQVDKKGYRTIKFFKSKEGKVITVHWWYSWVSPLLSFLLVFVILLVIFKFRAKVVDEKIGVLFFAVSFAMSWLLVALSQVLMDAWGVPVDIAETLIVHEPIYVMVSWALIWISHGVFLKKILIKLFD